MSSQCQVIGCKETAIKKHSRTCMVEACILGILYELMYNIRTCYGLHRSRVMYTSVSMKWCTQYLNYQCSGKRTITLNLQRPDL